MDVLVGWLANTSNYAKWRGGSSSIASLDDENTSNNSSSSSNTEQRTPKKILLEEIIENMRQVGIYHRHPKDVASKISTLQSNYRSAREWNETEGRRLRQAGFHPQTIHGNTHIYYMDGLGGCVVMVVVGDRKRVYDMSYLFSRHAQVCMWVVCEEEKEKKGVHGECVVVERWRLICVIDEKTTRDTLSLYRT